MLLLLFVPVLQHLVEDVSQRILLLLLLLRRLLRVRLLPLLLLLTAERAQDTAKPLLTLRALTAQ